MNLRLPPRYVNSPVKAIGHELPDAENMMYIRLHALAWQTNGHETPQLPLPDLFEYLRVERSTFYKRLSRLAELGWLRSTSPRPGFIKLFFGALQSSPPPWTGVHEDRQSVAVDSFTADSARINTTTAKQKTNLPLDSAVVVFNDSQAQARYEVLSAITEPERSRLANQLSKTPKQIKADIARWQKKGSPGIGLLVTMLRNDPPEPTEQERNHRYVTGEFADFIEH